MELPHHDRIADPFFREAVRLLDSGEADVLHKHLQQNPGLTQQRLTFPGNYFKTPTLLEFIAENPIRHGTLPPNIVRIAQVILEAGTELTAIEEALGLVATGRVARACQVQIPLIDLLCDHGANPDKATQAAAAHGEFEAVNTLLRRGAQLSLSIAAAIGRKHASSGCSQTRATKTAIWRSPSQLSMATQNSSRDC